MLPQDRKRCTKCRKTKLLEDFPRQKERRDGRGSWCCDCCNRRKRDRLTPEGAAKDRNRAMARAYQRALISLKRKHQSEFARLFAKAKKAEGL